MTLHVAVRALCEFTARSGDLDLRFTPAPSAQEGIAGHRIVGARRGAGYETELALSGQFEELQVRGRADGYDPARQQLEEIKTYRGRFDSLRENQQLLHWAQAKVYGHLLCQARGLAQLRVALVYYSLDDGQETVQVQTCQAEALQQFFDAQCRQFLAWARAEAAHRQARDAALRQLPFPPGAFRAGQRALAVAVYRAARDGQCLMVQAPTGIGKTLGTLFPALKAGPEAALDKLFFLTAKGTGHAPALHALDAINARLAQGEPPPASLPDPGAAAPGRLRVLDLQARDKRCEHPELACHPDSCPLARGFYDRLPAARAAALATHARLDDTALRDVARTHALCPYYLGQELARWADVVVGDCNYYYDGAAMLYALTQSHQWKVAVLVDEAHNLLERARHMYSAELSQPALAAARKAAPTALQRPLTQLQRAWNRFNRTLTSTYQACDSVPSELLGAVRRCTQAIAQPLAEQPLSPHDALLRFHFEALQFTALAEQIGPHALFDATQLPAHSLPGTRRGAAPPTRLCLRNVLPAPYLAPRHAAAHATVLFSGTLGPASYCRDTLGLPASTVWLDIASPFRAEQLDVHIARHISTRYRDRALSLAPIAQLVATQYQARPGNYLCFFSSFDYLAQVAEHLRVQHPQLPLWQQTPGMDEASRSAFLQRFTPDGQGVGLAVLGGAFSEGIDLPGQRLIGAFIATLGLPQLNPVNEQLRQRMAQQFGAARGGDYTYLYPGLQKVVQAAGRVIRTEHDRGTVYLIDDRYASAKVRALLPAWWRPAVLGR